MSVLESIRSRTGLLVGLVGLALAIFILERLLGSGSTLFGSNNTTFGKIDVYNIYVTMIVHQHEMVTQALTDKTTGRVNE